MRMWVRLCPGRMHGVVIVVDMELVLENESGLELLEFLEQNALTVANTWFSKKRLHLQTWRHPCSKLWHCKDFAIVQRRLLYLVSDCHAFHSAESHLDEKTGLSYV